MCLYKKDKDMDLRLILIQLHILLYYKVKWMTRLAKTTSNVLVISSTYKQSITYK